MELSGLLSGSRFVWGHTGLLEMGRRFRDFRIEWRRESCGAGGFGVEQLGA